GGITMLIDTSGKLIRLSEILPDIPFDSFLVPAIILLVAIALTQFVLAFMAIKKLSLTPFLGIFCGAILMIWTIVEIYYLSFNPLSVTFLVLAVLEIICAIFFRCSVNKQNRIFAGGLLR
ncbi:MAG: hypothetical protein PHQ49_00910, partial [Clostridia bacterium]|nr:hypothetical protein [Clostridia bacterium]